MFVQNARDTSIIPELANYPDCTVTLTDSWYRDSAHDRSTSVDHLVALQTDSLLNDTNPKVCAVLGPVEARAAEGVSVLTENAQIPQLQYGTIDRRLSRRHDFPSVARTISEVRYFATAVGEYLQLRPGMERDFIAIIYDFSDYGEQFEDPLEDGEARLKFESITEHIVQDDLDSIYESLGDVLENGYHTIILVTDRPPFMHKVAEVADELGIIGDDWLWVLSGDAMPPQYLEMLEETPNSPLDKLLRGAGVFFDYDPFILIPQGDKFLESWKSQDAAFVDQVNALHPLDPSHQAHFKGEPSYFQTLSPSPYSSFVYDSIMLVGLSACQLQEKKLSGEPLPKDVGGAHLAEIFETRFQGASGEVFFELTSEDTPNSRDPSSVQYGMFNLRTINRDDGMNVYTSILTSVYTDTKWNDVDGEKFLFFDGTPNSPMPLQTTFDYNYLSSGIQITGLTLTSLAMCIAIVSGTWVAIYRKERIVRAAQPEFLYILCTGAAIMAASLIFISFDEEKGWSEEKLSRACQAFPWLFIMGYLIIYCALFSKLWRINKLLSLRRQQVKIHHALWPFAIILSLSFIVLIVWQVVNPVIWIREVTQEAPLQSRGECASEDGATPYIIVLGCLMGIITVMTSYIAFKTKDVQSELSESSWIFYGIFSHIQIWIIGIPTYIILDDKSADASYLLATALIFVFSTVMVALVIWPKMFSWASERFFGGRANMKKHQTVINVSGKQKSTRITGITANTNSNNANSNASNSVLQNSMQNTNLNTSIRLSEINLNASADGMNNSSQKENTADSADMERHRNELAVLRKSSEEIRASTTKLVFVENEEIKEQAAVNGGDEVEA